MCESNWRLKVVTGRHGFDSSKRKLLFIPRAETRIFPLNELTLRICIQEWGISIRLDKPTSNELAWSGVNKVIFFHCDILEAQ